MRSLLLVIISMLGCSVPFEPVPLAVTRIAELEIKNYLQLTSSTGPTLKTTTIDPNGTIIEPRGSIRLRNNTAAWYQNLNGGTAWSRQDLPGATDPTDPVNTPDDFFYGSGFDGDCNFDGVATPVCAATLSGSTYTMARTVYADDVALASGVRLNMVGHGLLVEGVISGTGVFSNNGVDAVDNIGGAAIAANLLPGATVACNGNVGSSACTPAAGTSAPIWCVTNTASNAGTSTTPGTDGTACRGGGGGGGNGGVPTNGGLAGQVTKGTGTEDILMLKSVFVGRNIAAVLYSNNSPGGNAGGNGGGAGGGGGGAAGWVSIVARSCGAGGWTVEAIGGDGGTPSANNAGGGGGGAGGGVVIYCGAGTPPSSVSVVGGAKGEGTGGGQDGGAGGLGHSIVCTPSGCVHGGAP